MKCKCDKDKLLNIAQWVLQDGLFTHHCISSMEPGALSPLFLQDAFSAQRMFWLTCTYPFGLLSCPVDMTHHTMYFLGT